MRDKKRYKAKIELISPLWLEPKGGGVLHRSSLEEALTVTRQILKDAIVSASYNGKMKSNGQEAKNSAIRGSRPIQQVHSVVRDSVYLEIKARGLEPRVWPPMGKITPELRVTGLLKAKNQDVAITVDPHEKEVVSTGVNAGQVDSIGQKATNSALVIGVRSQMSSLSKNFDTLAERAFAETLNLRLRAPNITLGEVYLVPIHEFEDAALKNNTFGFKSSKIDLDKFVRIFNAISGPRGLDDVESLYKYNSTALIVADFSPEKVRILWDEADVAEVFDSQVAESMKNLMPATFTERIVNDYVRTLESLR
jgi:hypothetical protein